MTMLEMLESNWETPMRDFPLEREAKHSEMDNLFLKDHFHRINVAYSVKQKLQNLRLNPVVSTCPHPCAE